MYVISSSDVANVVFPLCYYVRRCTQGNLRFVAEPIVQHIVRRKHHVPVHGVPSTAIIIPNYVRYDAKTSLDY